MPSLEFNGFFRPIHQVRLLEPYEMHWSTAEFNKEANIEEIEVKQETRIREQIMEAARIRDKEAEAYERIMKQRKNRSKSQKIKKEEIEN